MRHRRSVPFDRRDDFDAVIIHQVAPVNKSAPVASGDALWQATEHSSVWLILTVGQVVPQFPQVALGIGKVRGAPSPWLAFGWLEEGDAAFFHSTLTVNLESAMSVPSAHCAVAPSQC